MNDKLLETILQDSISVVLVTRYGHRMAGSKSDIKILNKDTVQKKVSANSYEYINIKDICEVRSIEQKDMSKTNRRKKGEDKQ